MYNSDNFDVYNFHLIPAPNMEIKWWCIVFHYMFVLFMSTSKLWNEPYWYKWIINLMTKLHNDLTCKHKYCWKCWNLPVNCWEASEVLLIDTKRICFYSIMTDHFVHSINRIRLQHYGTSLGINYFNIKFTSCVSIYIITKKKKIWTFFQVLLRGYSFQ